MRDITLGSALGKSDDEGSDDGKELGKALGRSTVVGFIDTDGFDVGGFAVGFVGFDVGFLVGFAVGFDVSFLLEACLLTFSLVVFSSYTEMRWYD